MRISTIAISLVAMATLTVGCDQAQPHRRAAAPGLARLGDDACLQVDQCRELTEACGDNEACLDALNKVVSTQDGEETTIPQRVIAQYDSAPEG